MGRKLTEAQKAERAARRIEAKRRAELGPLFADQAEPVDRRALLIERRMGWAGIVAGRERLLGDATRFLQELEVQAVERLALEHLPAEDVETLRVKIRRTYPDATYWLSAWLDVLTGRVRIPGRVRVEQLPRTDPAIERVRMVEEELLPRDGWKPPFGDDWRRSHFWQLCEKCRRWHAPDQAECVPSAEGEEAGVLLPVPITGRAG